MSTPLNLLMQLPPRTRTVLGAMLTAVRLRAPIGKQADRRRSDESKTAARAAALADAESTGPRPEADEPRLALAQRAA